MGVYTTATITTTNPSERANSINEWFNSFDGISSSIDDYVYNDIEYSGAKISINDTNIEAFIGFNSSSVGKCAIYVKNGDVVLLHHEVNENGIINNTLHAYIDENCILLASSQTGNGFEIVYTKTIENRYLIGYYKIAGTSSVTIGDISNLVFEDVSDTARIPYSYSNMFPYQAVQGTIDFLAQAYFVDASGMKSFTSEILKECSTVTKLSTVSLPEPLNNHLSIGAHCIVPLDDIQEVSE